MLEHINSSPQPTQTEFKENEIGLLSEFDMEYFKTLEGIEGWIAIGQENCKNQRYFTVLNPTGDKLGVVGVYDTDDEQNITHTVVDTKYRGKGLSRKFKDHLMDKLNLPFITLTIKLDNKPSIRAAEKLPNIKRVSDTEYEENYKKAKYIYIQENKKV